MVCVAVAFKKLGSTFPAFALVLIIGVILSLTVFFTSVNDRPPRYHDVSLSQQIFCLFVCSWLREKILHHVHLWDHRTFRTKFCMFTVESMQFWELLNFYLIWHLLTTRVSMCHSLCCPSHRARTAGRLVQICQPSCIGHHLLCPSWLHYTVMPVMKSLCQKNKIK